MEATKPDEVFVFVVQRTEGPARISYRDPHTRAPIDSLERAKELAEEWRVPGGDWNAVSTYYGILRRVP
jgi:hypothetical protein